MSRRKGRILAVQALYSYDVGKMPLENVLTFNWAVPDDKVDVEEVEDNSSKDFARLIVTGTVEHLNKIDGLIESHLSQSWTMERISRVSLSILRMSVFMLLYQKEDVHPNIVIDEAVSIAKEFDADDTYRFINAVLDRISKEFYSDDTTKK